MTKQAVPRGLGARAELRSWYLGRLRPRLVEAVAEGVVEPGAVEELDLQVAGLVRVQSAVRGASGAVRGASDR